jgi:ubiquinol-cytochrome c reductase cytochrome b subunit
VGARVLDWLDSRTGYRRLFSRLLYELLPAGTGWAFTTGSVITLLLGVQFVSGLVLVMYYVPSPALAYDSVQYMMHDLPMGWMVRGLHVWGASFIVVATAVHMLRVFFYAAYKAPREVTWLTGLTAFLIVLGFSLSGYLLPWDQKAYWATTVTINVARSTPVVGESLANLLRGGPELGALTLGRWYAVHVFALPALIIVFVTSHLGLMRRHGISGPLRHQPGSMRAFFPWHVIKDTVVMAAVFASLVAMAMLVRAPLDEVANPADASYVPRPEWYFLALFQLLKYFPGPLEPVATQVIPGLAIGFLALLPFLDRHPERRPWARARLPFSIGFLLVGAGIVSLTVLGLNDKPTEGKRADDWGLLPIAGLELATGENSVCKRCHVPGGPAAPLEATGLRHDEEWLLNHMIDPVAIAPGVRTADDRPPRSAMGRFGAQAVVAYLRRNHAGIEPPPLDSHLRLAAMTYASTCVVCHKISGEGGSVGPDLTHVGRRRDEAGIREVIEDASLVFGDSEMPVFKNKLTGTQIDALASYLASRK